MFRQPRSRRRLEARDPLGQGLQTFSLAVEAKETSWVHVKLVGGFNPPEKYESAGMILPNIWKNKKDRNRH